MFFFLLNEKAISWRFIFVFFSIRKILHDSCIPIQNSFVLIIYTPKQISQYPLTYVHNNHCQILLLPWNNESDEDKQQ